MARKTIPAISVIIPMYNTEKYVGECLDSLLAQTFQDFEVIVVDDCSTDNSAAVVESYVTKFTRGGVERLQLVRSKVNSGGCASIPRNKGIEFSRGEYLLFVDSDDVITATALSELYEIARNFDVEVLHAERLYHSPGETAHTDKKLLQETTIENRKNFVEQPTLISERMEDRLQDIIQHKIWLATCNNLIKRDFLVNNSIKFPENVRTAEDYIFIFHIVFLAKKIMRIPNIFYVYRRRPNSNSTAGNSVEQCINRKVNDVFAGVSYLDSIMQKMDIFVKNPQYKYPVFNDLTNMSGDRFLPLYSQIPAYQLDGLIRRELEQVEDDTALAAFLFSRMNLFEGTLIQHQKLNSQYQSQIQQQQEQIQNLQEKLQHVRDYLLQLQNISQDLVNKMNQN